MAHDSLILVLRTSSAALALVAATATMAQTPAQLEAQPAAAPTPGTTQAPLAAAPGNAEPAQQDVQEIVVTGSRLGRAGYDAPTPVNVIGEERMRQLGIQNVGDALNQIPSFRAINSPTANFFRVSGNIGARTLDLRGLGATRTLTLVDGRRFVASGDNGTVDLNSIPTILVSQTDVVTGGASAAYGANAVAGVVNIILDKKLTGYKADVSSGISSRGDARTLYAAAAGGWDFGGGRGHLIAGIEYSKEYGIGPCETRPYCAKYTNYVANPAYNVATRTSTDGRPATLVLDHVMFAQNENGVLQSAVTSTGATLSQQVLNVGATSLPAALRGKQFDEAGNLIPYAFGTDISGIFAVYPNGDPTQPYLLGLSPTPLYTPTWHVSGTAHADYDLTDTISATAEFMYAKVKGGPAVSTPHLDNPARIDINNPYLSDATRATVLAANPAITTLLVNTSSYALGPSNQATSTTNTYRGNFGLKGGFGGGWSWDAAYSYGKVDSNVTDKANRIKEWTNAIDAVRVTAANVGTSGLPLGSIVCRTTLAAPANGCIPINLFGYGQVSQAAANRYLLTETQSRTYQQHVATANVRGSPFSTWAGEVKVAVGGEYRRDTAVGGADANTLAGNFINPATSALPFVKTTVLEGYVEAGVPLLKDSPLGKALDIDGAVRRTKYNTFGSATTWKIGGVYTIIPDITFRVTRSHDIRAPTAQESTPNATQIQLPLADPFVGGTTLQTIVTGGNPNLQLEKGDTFTAGVVLRPRFIRRLNVSVDYYNIKVKGAIDSLTGPAIATACRQQNILCNLITFNSNGSINTVFSNFQNLSKLHAEGVELVMDYRLPALGGNLDFQINGNYVLDLSTVGATGLTTQLDNVTGNAGSVTAIQGVPRWKADAVITYSRSKWSTTAHLRYIPEGYLDSTKTGPEEAGYNVNDPNSISTNRVDPAFYLDLTARVKIGSDNKYEAYVTVNNVFDKQEPKQLRLIGNALQFDPIGRFFKVGARAKF